MATKWQPIFGRVRQMRDNMHMKFQPDRATVVCDNQKTSVAVAASVDSSCALSHHQQLDGTILAASTRSLSPAQAVHCHGSRPGRASPRPPRGEEALPLLAAPAQPGRGGSRQQAGGSPLRWRLPQNGEACSQRGLFGKNVKDSLLTMPSGFNDSSI